LLAVEDGFKMEFMIYERGEKEKAYECLEGVKTPASTAQLGDAAQPSRSLEV
jgi:hypothetical protein